MAEANVAEPNERTAPLPRRPRRTHVINLCCAQSVHRVVEEVARSLEHLGFQVAVVCGAEARAALLGSRTDSEQPTIHVVCVQGSMQERVLKPLRQALATHGGPNHHLFVAVLDLAVPLAMVGQIRRFAEALERSAPVGPGVSGPGVVPGGRESSAAHRALEQLPTRSYPSMTQVVERGGTKPPLDPGDDGERPPRRTRPLAVRPPVAKIGPTSKYQAVTATHPVVTEPSVRKRRRERSRLRPSARRPRTADERVLALPEQDQSRVAAAPRREPPPPPAPGQLAPRQLAQRRSPNPPPTASASLPPPPPPPGRAKPPASAEPDGSMPHLEAGFRFSPPGATAADIRSPQSGPFPVASLSEMRRDPDKTMVMAESGVEEPRTASTLRLDEPPFAAGAKSPPELRGHQEEPVEPTMIIATPTDPAAAAAEVVEAEVVEAEVVEEITEDVVPDAPISSESSGTLVLRPRSAALDDEPRVVRAPAPSDEPTDTVSESAKTLLRNDGTFPSARELLQKVEASQPAQAPAPKPTPEDKGSTVVGPAPTRATKPEPSTAERDADAPAMTAPDPGASPSARRPSAIPTERHPLAAKEPAPSRPPRGRKRALDARSGVLEDRSIPPAAAVRPRDPARRPRPKQGSRYGWLWILLALLTAGGGWGAYQAGLLDGVLGRSRPAGSTVADASATAEPNDEAASDPTLRRTAETGIAPPNPASTGPDDTGTTTDDGAAQPAVATAAASTVADTEDPTSSGDAPDPSTGEPEPAAGSTTGADAPAPDDGAPDAPAPDDGAPDAPAPDDGPPDAPAPDDGAPDAPAVVGDGPQLSADEQQLTSAVEARRVFMLKTLFATKRQGTATTFAGAWQRCAKLEIDGVTGWRLPHRREMKLVNAVLNLPAGAFWTRTVPPEDKSAAYVLDSSNGQLSLFLKQEPNGEVVCVREREHPEE